MMKADKVDNYTLELADGLVEGMKHLVNIPSGEGIRLQLVLHIQSGILEALNYYKGENLTKHNNDFKKPCSKCNGKGEIKSVTKGLDGYDLEDCPDCEGHGFIKL